MEDTTWLHDYALLALRVNRQVTGLSGTVLIYRGPATWRARAEDEEPPPAGRLAEDADALLERLPAGPRRAAYLAAHVRALRAVARRLAGEELPLAAYASTCLGVTAGWVPEELFEEAHARLDAALPPDEEVGCQLESGVGYLAAGHYDGGVRSVIHVNRDLPFNLADLLSVVAHEGHPGHIAESLLKERHLVDGQGRLDHQVRFMLAPSFVLSEGLGLHAQEIIFPGDEAQAWLNRTVFPEHGITPDGSDFAAIHRARNALFGVYANAALLAAEGRPDTELAAYLSRWALLTDAETAAMLGPLKATSTALYVMGYFHGWRLLDAWLDAPDRTARVRRLLTEQLLPADLTADAT